MLNALRRGIGLAMILVVIQLVSAKGTITGQVVDEFGQALTGANVWIAGTSLGTSTDIQGRFEIRAVPDGSYNLIAAFIGYRSEVQIVEIPGSTINLNFSLMEGSVPGEEVIVSASRRPQKIVDAPTTMTVINSLEVRRGGGYSFAESIENVNGVDTYRTGLDGISINARGFMTGYNYRFQLMTDGMNGMLTGNGLSAPHMSMVSREDVERIEVILGPSSALYGPNAHNGLLNVITRHPRDSRGGTVVVGAGQNNMRSLRTRFAGILGNLSYKLNAEMLSGKDYNDNRVYWHDADSDGIRDDGEFTTEGNNSPIKHDRIGGALFYRLGGQLELGGGYDYYQFSTRNVTNIGHNLLQDWVTRRWFAQLTHPRFYARVHQTGNQSDKYYQEDLKAQLIVFNGLPEDVAIDAINLVDKSSHLAVEAQGNVQANGINLIGGFNYDRENPVSERTVLLDRGVDPRTGEIQGGAIIVNQAGVYGQVESDLPLDLAATAAFRYDVHDNYGDQFSPRLGLVWKGLRSGNLRATWNHAFQAPAIAQQYLYIYVPGSRYQAGNGLGFTLADGTKIDPLKPETNQTLEFGYKGTLMKGLYFDANYYFSHYRNFISGFIPVGPAVKMGDTDLDSSVPLLTYLNFGELDISGFDLAAEYQLSRNLKFSASYSFVNRAGFDEAKSAGLKSADSTYYQSFYFNTPERKWTFGIQAADLLIKGLEINANLRHVDEYDFVTGRWFATTEGEGTSSYLDNPYYLNNGPLGGFTLVDLSLSYLMSSNIQVQCNVDNLFDAVAYQMVGSPSTGRMANLEVRYIF